MNNSKSLAASRTSSGDAAVDGLLHGAMAGVVMAIYLILIGLLTGAGMAATLSAFDLGQGTSPVRGALIHLAVAGIYGMVFSLLYRSIGRRQSIGRGGTIVMGMTFGLVLWLITQITLKAGINVALSSLPATHFAAAHVIYGAVLGWLARRVRAE